MRSFDLVIIGGSASGLAAAINAHRKHPGINIAVIERLPRVGKKILATGNGRCNLTNLFAASHPYRNAEFAAAVMEKYGVDETLAFFESLGLRTFADGEGRVYPLSNTASSVLDSLRFALDPQKITVICDKQVEKIKKTENGFLIDNEIFSKKLIIACGGKASPAQGSNGSGYPLAKSLGHSLTALVPALVPLTADSAATKPLKGIRIHSASLTLESGGRALASSSGELLFTDSGISGIAAMELASALEREKVNDAKEEYFTVIDFLPGFNYNELCSYLESLCKSKTLRDSDNLLGGLLPKAAGVAICKAAKLYKSGAPLSDFGKNELERIAETAKCFKLRTFGSKGFDCAQVTSGGIKVGEINPATMESRLCRGLYFAGEIADVDGGCGGVNLQWAWSSGLLAGELGE